MPEQPHPHDVEAYEADVADQSIPVDADEADAFPFGAEPRLPAESDPADAAEQAIDVPLDEDEYR